MICSAHTSSLWEPVQSLSLRRNATKSNLQDVAEPPLSPAPSSGNAHRGDDILLLISGSMCIDRDRASVLCQELLDRYAPRMLLFSLWLKPGFRQLTISCVPLSDQLTTVSRSLIDASGILARTSSGDANLAILAGVYSSMQPPSRRESSGRHLPTCTSTLKRTEMRLRNLPPVFKWYRIVLCRKAAYQKKD